jgi:hypothetical protein
MKSTIDFRGEATLPGPSRLFGIRARKIQKRAPGRDASPNLANQSSTQRLFVHAGILPGVPIELQEEDDLLWMREPFLSSQAEHGFLVVHGHTPTKNLKPELRHNRLNLDTGACFGGPLTAAAFIDEARVPAAFVFDDGQIGELEALDTKTARLEVIRRIAEARRKKSPGIE